MCPGTDPASLPTPARAMHPRWTCKPWTAMPETVWSTGRDLCNDMIRRTFLCPNIKIWRMNLDFIWQASEWWKVTERQVWWDLRSNKVSCWFRAGKSLVKLWRFLMIVECKRVGAILCYLNLKIFNQIKEEELMASHLKCFQVLPSTEKGLLKALVGRHAFFRGIFTFSLKYDMI